MLHNESTIVSKPDSEDMRRLCGGLTLLYLTGDLAYMLLDMLRNHLTSSVGSRHKENMCS